MILQDISLLLISPINLDSVFISPENSQIVPVRPPVTLSDKNLPLVKSKSLVAVLAVIPGATKEPDMSRLFIITCPFPLSVVGVGAIPDGSETKFQKVEPAPDPPTGFCHEIPPFASLVKVTATNQPAALVVSP